MSSTDGKLFGLTPERRALLARMMAAQGVALPAATIPRRAGDGPAPLSLAQERLWLLDRLFPGTAAYNVPLALRLRGAVDAERLRLSIETILHRHEALRTVFDSSAGEPRQRVLAPEPFALGVVSAEGESPEQREEAALAAARAEAARPFDLERGPVLRALLVRISEDDHLLVLTLHHAAADGWSVGILARELGEAYAALAEGREPALRPLSVSYCDFAAWQRDEAAKPEFAERLAWWARALAGAPAALELPADRPRPPAPTFAGDVVPFAVPAEVAARLRTLAQREGTTLFVVLMAAFKAFLHRCTGQADLVVGTPTAGRGRPELEGLIGCFFDLVPLRTMIDGDASFRSLLAAVRDGAAEAFGHEAPFDRIVEASGAPREVSRTPLVQVVFAVQAGSTEALSLPGVRVEPLSVEAPASKHDLSVYVREAEGGALAGRAELSADLYDRGTVERWMRHFVRALDLLSGDPDAAVDGLDVMDDAERSVVLREWNATDTPWTAEPLHRRFEERARTSPDEVALVHRAARITYGELNARANRRARWLIAAGVRPEDRVGLLLDRSPEMLVGMLAVLKAGAAYLPLDPGYPAERLRFMAGDAGVRLVLARAAAGRLDGADVPVAVWEDTEADAASLDGSDVDVAVDPANPAYVIYTSGSTGRPKGVVVEHRNVAAFFAAMRSRVGEAPGTWLAVTSMSFDISVLELLWTLTNGSRVVLSDGIRASASASTAPTAGGAWSARPIDFSLFYFSGDASGPGGSARYRLLLDGARFADEHGFTAVWTPERHFHAFGGIYPSPAVTSAAVAALTRNVRLRAGSVVLPLHDTLRVAEEWSVVDNLSDGRVELSFASGWHADDFVLAPERYAGRREAMFDMAAEVRHLWRGGTVHRASPGGKSVEVGTLPRPVQAELPFWITAGGTPETFRRAGACGAHLLTHLLGQTVEDLERSVRAYRDARAEAGLDPDGGRVAVMLHAFVGNDLDAVRETVRAPFREYLRTSFDLVARLLGRQGDPAGLTAAEVEDMLDLAFERYWTTAALMGTPDTCLATLDRLKRAGVDEVACLVDFGVPDDAVLAALPALAELRDAANRPSVVSGDASPAELIRVHGVTHLQCTPSLAGVLAADPDSRAALQGIETMLLGGEALPAALASDLAAATDARIVNVYGPTETTIWSAAHEVELVDGGPATVPIGRALENERLYVVDAALRPVPVGVAGELLIGGAGVVRGYHGRAALTAERFVPDAFGARPGARLYRTGDLVRWTAAGVLEFLGRTDQQVKVRGHRIEPGEVEAALRAHPAVRDAVVVAQGETGGERTLVGYFTPAAAALRPLTPVGDAEERERVLDGLPRYTLPDGTVIAHQADFMTRSLHLEIFEQQVYLRHGITLEDGAYVLDVGANIGMFTLFAHAAARDVRTWSFEPIPRTFRVLDANTRLFGLNARVLNVGVGEAPGVVPFTHYPEQSGLSGRYADVERDRDVTRSVIRSWLAEESEVARGAAGHVTDEQVEALLAERFRPEVFECPIRTLADVVREEGITRIDLLKVDVEKSEHDVLMGMGDEVWPMVRQMVIEVDTEELLGKVLALLDARGFDHLVDHHVTVREGAADGSGGEYVYMVYAKRRGETVPLARTAADTGTLHAAGAASPGALRRWLGERLPEHMVPSLLVQLAELPLTPNGKVDRARLPRATAADAASAASFVAPGEGLESTIAEAWREVLSLERVGVHDNFFELGGTSLRLAAVHRILEQRLERRVPIVDLFRHPTVARLAGQLGAADATAADHRTLSDARSRAERQLRARRPVVRGQAGD